MVRFKARTLVVMMYAAFVACGEPHQPVPPAPAPSPAAPPPAPAPPPPAPPTAPTPKDSTAVKENNGSYTWQSGPIAAP